MKRLAWKSRVAPLLAVLNLLIVAYVYSQHYEGSWGGFVLFCLDFPISLLSFVPLGWNQWMFFSVIGPLWWYLIGVLISTGIRNRNGTGTTYVSWSSRFSGNSDCYDGAIYVGMSAHLVFPSAQKRGNHFDVCKWRTWLHYMDFSEDSMASYRLWFTRSGLL